VTCGCRAVRAVSTGFTRRTSGTLLAGRERPDADREQRSFHRDEPRIHVTRSLRIAESGPAHSMRPTARDRQQRAARRGGSPASADRLRAGAAVDDTEIAMFAEYVFTTLDLTAGKYGGNVGPGWDIEDTDDFISLMLSTYTASSNFELRVTSGNNVETLRWMPDFYGINVSQAESDFSYLYFRDPAAPFQTSAFTYSLTLAVSTWKGYGSGATTYAVLKVWPGETKGPDSAARIFYREILPIR
jgi:hypothetical protein